MASGDTLLVFTPMNNEPPAAAFATLDSRNGSLVLDFDATADEEAVFSFPALPRHYDGGGITANAKCMMTSATSGNVVLQGAFERGNTDRDADSFASFVSSGAVAVNATSGIPFNVPIAFTDGAQIDSLAVGEPLRFKLRRDADDTSATDSATGDLELLGIELQETP